MDSKRPARRQFLKSGAALAGGFTLGGAAPAFGQAPPPSPPMIKGDKDQIPYGDRSKFVTSVRIAHGGRPSPDAFGLYFHIATPLQDSVGVITPSSLHFVGTTRGSYIPEIDPREHRLLIHGMVDRPLTFTMEDLKRLPSVTRLHFMECAGNRASRRAKTVQESHGMTSCAEWTGVPLSLLLKECGLKGGASWFVAEGSEEVKGASSMPIAKAMDDCFVAYGMNGEPLRPQQGFPLRLMIPGFEGIFHTKYLRRIKIVNRSYMNYNDFGHLDRDPKVAALEYQIGPNQSSRSLPGDISWRAADSTRLAAWLGPVVEPSKRWKCPLTAGNAGTLPRSRERRSAWRMPDSVTCGIGTDKRPSSFRAARTRSVRFNRRANRSPSTGTSPSMPHSACRGWTTAFNPGGSPRTGA